MSDKNTTYRFFPTVRAGYRPDSTFSKEPELSDAGTTSVTLDVKAEGEEGTTTETTGVDLSIYGPGEVTNLDTDQVVRVEPEPETTDFPPNYFPLVEFDNPQLPWLFSPERADDQGRNRPWVCLVAVPNGSLSFEPAGTGPLPVLETSTEQLPDAAEAWAWAHAQMVGSGDPKSAFGSGSTSTVSRLLCPRNLDPQTKYRACVVPTFEAGRRAGLGLEPYPDDGTRTLAWTDEDSIRLPVYHYWEFTTAKRGDFESLARELDPAQLGPDVGFRTVDVSNPGPVDLKLPADAAADIGTVGVGGALKATGAEPDVYEKSMRDRLRKLLNETSERVEATNDDEPDYGVVGPPLYGQWHAGIPELEPPSVDAEGYYYPKWFNTLNADPRNRIAAGFGTQIIRDEQDRLMASAWEQFGEIQKANEKLRRFQLSERILAQQHEQIASLSTGSLLAFSSPVHAYAFDAERGKTVHGESVGSDMPTPLSSTAFRRVTRPNGPVARRPEMAVDLANLTTRLETGRLPQVTDGLDFTTEQSVGSGAPTTPSDGPQSGGPALQSDGGEPNVPADVDIVNPGAERELPTFEMPRDVPRSPTDGTEGGSEEPQTDTDVGQPEPGRDIERALTALDSLDEHIRTAERAIADLSAAIEGEDTETVEDLTEASPTVVDHCGSIRRNTFDPLTRALGKVLAEPQPETLAPDFDRAASNDHLQNLHGAQRQLETDIETAVQQLRAGDPPKAVRRRLDRAEQDVSRLQQTSQALRSALVPAVTTAMTTTMGETEGPAAVEMPDIGNSSPASPRLPSKEKIRGTVLRELDPQFSIPEYASEVTGIPNLRQREDPVGEVMASPSFTEATYNLLAELNQEYFLPRAGDVPRDSVGVLQTNPTFVEAFMAGLNHEFARELEWRQYPTDKRGTYFRRFWDRRGSPNADSSNPEEMADIEPMHTWDQSDLGQNSPTDDDAQVVLMVRGELLRRYPNTDIFVAKAVEDDGDRVPALPDTHVTRDDAGDDVKFHEFRGTLDPDMTFFGFDLSPEEALYDPYQDPGREEPDDHADEGWFFVLQEPPAETRFGMDVGTEEDVGSTPLGITHDGKSKPEQMAYSDFETSGAEHGWSGLSWAHLVEEDGPAPEDVTYVDVDGSRPGKENWRVETGDSHISNVDVDGDIEKPSYDQEDAAEWGYNSAHVARATWQLPVRISIHADDMMPEEPPNDTDWRNVQFDSPVVTITTTVQGESQ